MNCTNCNAELAGDSRFCRVCGLNLSNPGSGPLTGNSGTVLKTRLSQVLKGRYRVTKLVGRGGMGAVFLAEDLTLERPVAIKVLPPEVAHDERLVGRFEREARTAAKLDHPNIIPIHAVEHSGDLYYFVMKFVAGESLDDIFKRGRVTIQQAQDYLWEAARALGHAHRRGVVHRDIKPANIMLDHDGRVMLTDFGISKAMQSATQYTGTGQVIGTPHYMSPEQAKGGEVDGRSDQYALAIVGYQMVTGRLPFADDSIHAVIYKHVSEEPPFIQELNPDCPPFIATAIHRAMRKKPGERFADMEMFAQAICPDRRLSVPTTANPRGGVERSSVSSAPTEISQTSTLERSSGRRRSMKVAAMFAVLLMLGGGGYWSWSQGLLAQFGGPGAPGDVLDNGALQSAPDVGGGSQTLASNIDSSSLATVAPVEDSSRDERDDTTSQTTEPVPETPPLQTQTGQRPPARTVADEPVVAATGLLSVDADPFADVYIDGDLIGETPVIQHALSVGRHIVTLERSNCVTITDTVLVRGNDNIGKRYSIECQRFR